MVGEHGKCKLFQTLVQLVMEEVGKIPLLRKTARTKQHQFSIDICLIACGVRQVYLSTCKRARNGLITQCHIELYARCAYLVDAVAMPDPVHTFSALLGSLRDKVCLLQTLSTD